MIRYSADIAGSNKGIVVRATGSQMKFQGFLVVYEERNDDDNKDDEHRMLPALEEGMVLNLIDVSADQAFTRPPPRYTEASLVKELEKLGIGRPSTYTAIMNKIQGREYTVKESGRLKPTELGRVVTLLLENNFQEIMNIGFTAHMEDDLELVAENRKDWKILLNDFWVKFIPTLELAEKEGFVPKIMTDLDCPVCGSKLQKIWFKSKYFYGCSRYPDCTFSSQIEEMEFNKDEYAADFDWDQKCPVCQSPMKLRHGRFGPFLGCTNYPSCKGIVNIPKKGEAVLDPHDTALCPAIGCPGHMVGRKSRFGKTFYFSCSTFPECDVIVNDLSQLDAKYPHHPRTAYVKKPRKGKPGTAKAESKAPAKSVKLTKAKKTTAKEAPAEKKTRKMPALQLSAPLADVVGSDTLPRGEVLKKLWDYIRLHGLQDAKNKRLIHPDAKLAKIFGSPEAVDMFKLAGLLGKHMSKE